MTQYLPMASDGNYPSNEGIRVGQTSVVNPNFRSTHLARVSLSLVGTVGSGSPSYQVQVQSAAGDWVNVRNMVLTAPGSVSAPVQGHAFRLVAVNGSSPGTGANTPQYHLAVEKIFGVPGV